VEEVVEGEKKPRAEVEGICHSCVLAVPGEFSGGELEEAARKEHFGSWGIIIISTQDREIPLAMEQEKGRSRGKSLVKQISEHCQHWLHSKRSRSKLLLLLHVEMHSERHKSTKMLGQGSDRVWGIGKGKGRKAGNLSVLSLHKKHGFF